MRTRVLFVDDDRLLGETLRLALVQGGYEVILATSVREATTVLLEQDVDVVVTDINMQGANGLELCRHAAANRTEVPVIVLTAFGSLDAAVAAIRAGAYDFLSKPVDAEFLAVAIDRAAEHRALGKELKRLRIEVGKIPRLTEIVGQSHAMQVVYDLVDRVAESEASVLLTGESGTGKEIMARAIHHRSRRAGRPFVAVNCAAIPESLIESELFGHAKGAFTDARSSKTGMFVEADGGTLFLDEIGDLPISIQPKLLRALQERVVRPVGANADRAIDVRVVAATNRDLESAMEAGRFREDLFYRINVVQIPLPPLRARAPDILPLAAHFLAVFSGRTGKNISGFSRGAAEKLMAYPWPGNVRELRNCVERAVALARFVEITVDELPEKVREHRLAMLCTTDDPDDLVPLEEIERRYVARVMEAVRGNKTAAAKILGIDRKRLYRMLGRLGIEEDRGDAHGP